MSTRMKIPSVEDAFHLSASIREGHTLPRVEGFPSSPPVAEGVLDFSATKRPTVSTCSKKYGSPMASGFSAEGRKAHSRSFLAILLSFGHYIDFSPSVGIRWSRRQSYDLGWNGRSAHDRCALFVSIFTRTSFLLVHCHTPRTSMEGLGCSSESAGKEGPHDIEPA